jgi:hypothetical protein
MVLLNLSLLSARRHSVDVSLVIRQRLDMIMNILGGLLALDIGLSY